MMKYGWTLHNENDNNIPEWDGANDKEKMWASRVKKLLKKFDLSSALLKGFHCEDLRKLVRALLSTKKSLIDLAALNYAYKD